MASNSSRSTSTNLSYNKYKSNKAFKNQLKKAEKKQPTYTNRYSTDISNALSGLDRGFEFDASSNPVYQAYANDYRLLGNIAADQNAMQTEQLSGGYGTTYSGNVANQQLQGYLESEKNIIPALYQQERANYLSDQSNAVNKANLYNQLEGQDFNQFLTKLNAWNQNREYAYNKWYNDYLANSTSVSKGRTTENSVATRELASGGRSGRRSSRYGKLGSSAISSREGAMAYLENNGLDASNVMSKEQFQNENAKRRYSSYAGALLDKSDPEYDKEAAARLDQDYSDYLLNYIRQAQGLEKKDWFSKTQKRIRNR